MAARGKQSTAGAEGDGQYFGATTPPFDMIRSVPFVHRSPHALQRDFGPEGPDRHSGVFVEPQCSHWLTEFCMSPSRRIFAAFWYALGASDGTGRRPPTGPAFTERAGPGDGRTSRTMPASAHLASPATPADAHACKEPPLDRMSRNPASPPVVIVDVMLIPRQRRVSGFLRHFEYWGTLLNSITESKYLAP